MAKHLSNNESPVPQEGAGTGTDSESFCKNVFSREREEQLFQLVRIGAATLDRLTESISNGVLQHIAGCGDSPFATERLREVVKNTINKAISQQSLEPTGHISFCDSLCRSIRTELAALLHDEPYDVECGSSDWLNQVCNETMIQLAIDEELWEMEEEWESLTERERAIQEIIENHLPLAKSVARTKLRNPHEHEDLTQEAILILRRLIDGFNLTRGFRFGSYAKPVLLKELRRQYDAKQGLTRYSSQQVNTVNKVESQLTQRYGRRVTTDELYAILGHSEETRIEIENARRLLKAGLLSQPDSSLLSAKATSCSEELSDEELQNRRHIVIQAFRDLSDIEKRVVVGKMILDISYAVMAKRYRRNHRTIKRLYESGMEKLTMSIVSQRVPRKPR